MTFAAWNGPATILLGLLILFVAFLMRRSGLRSRKRRPGDSAEEVHPEFPAAERSALRTIEQLELRLHDYGREIDALSQTRIALLRELITQAERLSAELEHRLGSHERLNDEGETRAA